MKKTTNYQLNQWDAEDRILREDFNQDNKKLDNAIAALRDACPLVKVVDFTTQSTQSKVEISLAGQNMENYRELYIYVTFSSTTTEDNAIYLTLNDLKEYWDSSSTSEYGVATVILREATKGKATTCFTLLLGPLIAGYCRATYYTGSYFSAYTSDMKTVNLSGDQLNKMALCCMNGTIGAGSRITVLGVRV